MDLAPGRDGPRARSRRRADRRDDDFSEWFADQGLDLAPRYYDSYEAQIEDLLDGAWTPRGTRTSLTCRS
jgi:hypothetical protein